MKRIGFKQFNETIFEELLKNLGNIQDSDSLVFNTKYAIANIREQENAYYIFIHLMKHFTDNEKLVSDLIVNNLSVNLIKSKYELDNILNFSNILQLEILDLLDCLNENGMISENCIEAICENNY